jgi:chemotaxis protein CheZ
MSETHIKIEESIASLVELTDAFLLGEYGKKMPEIDAEGLLSTLANKINSMLVNMQTVQVPLASAGEQAPNVVSHARDVVELMEQSTNAVLDKSDEVITQVEKLADLLVEQGMEQDATPQSALTEIKAAMYDIIASQSYQDAARQKMERMIGELDQIRSWLIEVLVILNIKQDGSAENVEKKKELLREVHDSAASSPLKQNLVDDLLSEFGF